MFLNAHGLSCEPWGVFTPTLEAAGWAVTGACHFLQYSDSEVPCKAWRTAVGLPTPGLCALSFLPKPVASRLVNSNQVRLSLGPARPRSPGRACLLITQDPLTWLLALLSPASTQLKARETMGTLCFESSHHSNRV